PRHPGDFVTRRQTLLVGAIHPSLQRLCLGRQGGGITRPSNSCTAHPGRVCFYLIEIIELFGSVAFDPLDRRETYISCGFLRCLGEARTPPNPQTTPNPRPFPHPDRV